MHVRRTAYSKGFLVGWQWLPNTESTWSRIYCYNPGVAGPSSGRECRRQKEGFLSMSLQFCNRQVVTLELLLQKYRQTCQTQPFRIWQQIENRESADSVDSDLAISSFRPCLLILSRSTNFFKGQSKTIFALAFPSMVLVPLSELPFSFLLRYLLNNSSNCF